MLLKTILFVLIGMEILVFAYDVSYMFAGLLAIPIILLCKFLFLLLQICFFKKELHFVPNINLVMTWGGLRSGIFIAMALSLTESMNKYLFLFITNVVVVFSILVQGLTVERSVKKLSKTITNY